VLQHYHVCVHTNSSDHLMVDVDAYVRRNLHKGAMRHHVLQGGISQDRLLSFTQLSTKALIRVCVNGPVDGIEDSSVCRVKHCLQQYGPALVSKFAVFPHFRNSTLTSFSEVKSGETLIGYHAMVLVGYREDEELKETYFLLQNWWKDRYFIEVSASYLEEVQADVVFVCAKLTRIPQDLPVINAEYTETAVDCMEALALED
jgi:hypothetical protein